MLPTPPDLTNQLLLVCERARRQAAASGGPVVAGVVWSVPVTQQTALTLADSAAADDYAVFWRNSDHTLTFAGLEPVWVLRTAGEGRFQELGTAARQLLRDGVWDGPDDAPLPRVWAGFTFHPPHVATERWAGFAGSEGVLHRFSVQCGSEGSWARISDMVTAQTSAEDWASTLAHGFHRIWQPDFRAAVRPETPVDLTPLHALMERADHSAEHFVAGVERALPRIAAGEVTKVVLARCALYRVAPDFGPETALRTLCERFSDCTVYGFGYSGELFAGATPERLLVRKGQTLRTMALAGSARRGTDSDGDDVLRQALLDSPKDRSEHGIVVDTVVGALRHAGAQAVQLFGPEVVTLPNIHHLRTRIEATMPDPDAALLALAALHPTPAVCGEPRDAAAKLIAELEDLDRGWYAAPVGWFDGAGDFAFVVALRCGLFYPPYAVLFAGAGIVAGSEPQAELAETEVKLGAMRDALMLKPFALQEDGGLDAV
jgi:salicylate biosynthesis isochorismate synthase